MIPVEYRFTVNGFPVTARYDQAAVDELFLPFLRALADRRAGMDRRLVAFLAAPPGTGKSTLAAFLSQLSRRTPGLMPVQAVGMDGFHHRQAYLNAHTFVRNGVELPLARIKGAPESFDLPRLAEAVSAARAGGALTWPVYDRRLHDVAESGETVTGEILLVEGNWLMLDEPGWRDLQCDADVFIEAGEALLKDRLIQRKIQGGMPPEAAAAFYAFSDGPNVARCLNRSRRGEWRWRLDGTGGFHAAEADA